jgi:hypothetical protein
MDEPTKHRIEQERASIFGNSRLYCACLPKLRAKGIGDLDLDNRSKPLAEGGYFEDHTQPPRSLPHVPH